MVGDGGTTSSRTSSLAAPEEKYVKAKTSVWWDVENCQVPRGFDPHSIAQNISSALVKMNYCGPVSISAYCDTNRIPASVQHALSSTGVALNHVPAGVKDASDKKILVDMLFWAVDNPAPANYLLISGDRDFSNALHQLRMRRYNILLAQPQKASVPLVAAAKSVWLWTTLIAGGSPIPPIEPTQPAQLNKKIITDTSWSDETNNSVDTTAESSEYLKHVAPARTGEAKYAVKCVPKNTIQPGITRTTSVERKLSEFNQLECEKFKQSKKAPHEFFDNSGPEASTDRSAPMVSSTHHTEGKDDSSLSTSQNRRQQPLIFIRSSPSIAFAPHHTFVQKSQSRDVQPMPHKVDGTQNPVNPGRQNGQVLQPSNTISSFPANVTAVQENQSPRIPEYEQGLIGVVLLALNTLKLEKVMPTEANLLACISYGDTKQKDRDARKALDCAIKHEMVVKQTVGKVQFYAGRNERLWTCVNPMGGSPNQHPKKTWEEIKRFLVSSNGRSMILGSRCRYESALILKKSCLQNLALGDVLQILNMVCTMKKWIIHHQSGWQPISITLKEPNNEASAKVSG